MKTELPFLKKSLTLVSTVILAGSNCGYAQDETPSQPKPNIIFIEVDDLMPRFMNKVGGGFGITPNLDRLATQGIYFKNGVCQAAQCGPSRNSLITGQYPHNLGFFVNKQLPNLPQDTWTFPRELNKAGYSTAYIGKSHLRPYFDRKEVKANNLSKSDIHKQFFGFDFVNCTGERGKMLGDVKNGKELDYPFIDYLKKKGKLEQFIKDNKEGKQSTMEDDFDYLDGYITKVSLDYLKEKKGEKKPFFIWMNYCLPHGPYDVPERYFKKAREVKIPAPLTKEFGHPVPDAQLKYNKEANWDKVPEDRLGEVANVLFVDTMIGHILKTLEDQQQLENTVIIFFSDHSIFLGNHGRTHKQSLYEECVNASLIISYPAKFKQNMVSSHPVELLDLLPTTFELAGIENHNKIAKNGVSLMPILEGKGSNGRELAYTEILGGIGATGERYRYMLVGDEEFLYDRENDPVEMINLAKTEAKLCAEFRKKVEAWKTSSGPWTKPVKEIAGKDDSKKDKEKAAKKAKKKAERKAQQQKERKAKREKEKANQ